MSFFPPLPISPFFNYVSDPPPSSPSLLKSCVFFPSLSPPLPIFSSLSLIISPPSSPFFNYMSDPPPFFPHPFFNHISFFPPLPTYPSPPFFNYMSDPPLFSHPFFNHIMSFFPPLPIYPPSLMICLPPSPSSLMICLPLLLPLPSSLIICLPSPSLIICPHPILESYVIFPSPTHLFPLILIMFFFLSSFFFVNVLLALKNFLSLAVYISVLQFNCPISCNS